MGLQGRLDEAISYCQQALALRPGYPEAHANLGRCWERQGRLEEAVASYRQALLRMPNSAELYGNLGNALSEQGKLKEALQAYQQAIARKSQDPQLRLNRALILLLQGEFADGWANYEQRWRIPQLAARLRTVPAPRWHGTPPRGKTILIQAEQGFGDTIQFVRYASTLKEMGARVILECPATLKALLTTCPGVDAVIDQREDIPAVDGFVPLLSLPGLLGTNLENIPSHTPYLRANRPLPALLRPEKGLCVGLVWAPGRNYTFAKRYCPLEAFEPLFALSGVHFFSLYKGEQAHELEPYQECIVDLGSNLQDFTDTAAIIAHLDLVITVDTAVAHLAGAMGKPVWVLLPFVPDWRWLLNREDSPWYPTARLFRQSALGDWQTPLLQVAQKLRILARS